MWKKKEDRNQRFSYNLREFIKYGGKNHEKGEKIFVKIHEKGEKIKWEFQKLGQLNEIAVVH